MRTHRSRDVVRWAAFTLAAAALSAAPAAAQAPAGSKGCALQGVGPDDPGVPPRQKSTGDAELDAQMAANFELLGARFGVLPRLYYIVDAPPNAYFYAATVGDDADFPPERNPFGTVFVGLNLLEAERRATPAGEKTYTITAIIAHELGHTLQAIKNSRLTTMQKELQADFLAGWAIKLLQRTGAPDIDEVKVFGTFYNRGDYLFNDPNHHGTRKQRLAAFNEGLEVEDDDPNVAYAKAEEYVKGLPPEKPPAPKPEAFAKNLGVFYERLPNPDGTFAAKVLRATADSVAAAGGIEPGDIILALDGMPFRTEEDVLNHVDQTTVTLIDVRTGQRQEAVIQIR